MYICTPSVVQSYRKLSSVKYIYRYVSTRLRYDLLGCDQLCRSESNHIMDIFISSRVDLQLTAWAWCYQRASKMAPKVIGKSSLVSILIKHKKICTVFVNCLPLPFDAVRTLQSWRRHRASAAARMSLIHRWYGSPYGRSRTWDRGRGSDINDKYISVSMTGWMKPSISLRIMFSFPTVKFISFHQTI